MRLKQALSLSLVLFLATGLAACQSAEPPAEEAAEESAPEAMPEGSVGAIVEVTLADYSFTAPPTLPSGWNTFRMSNTGAEPHFMILWKLPEGVEFADWTEIARMFGEQYARFVSGELDADTMMAEIGDRLPPWFGDAEGTGVGLISPGGVAVSTVELEPGEYAVECYVKSAEHEFHGELGMLRPLIVTDETSGGSAPEADIEVVLFNYAIDFQGQIAAGEQTFAVRATDDAEGLVGHDVHLARLEPDTEIDEVVAWMNFVGALEDPAPVEFLGGVEELSAGETSYFTATLEPGRYVLISEGYASAGMVHEFSVE